MSEAEKRTAEEIEQSVKDMDKNARQVALAYIEGMRAQKALDEKAEKAG